MCRVGLIWPTREVAGRIAKGTSMPHKEEEEQWNRTQMVGSGNQLDTMLEDETADSEAL